jgi:peptidoglycan/xylan/chitin deacetylase (PgdA/CDA1 family)
MKNKAAALALIGSVAAGCAASQDVSPVRPVRHTPVAVELPAVHTYHRAATGRLVLFLDDCTEDQARIALPLLKAHGDHATLACISNDVGSPGFLSASQIREAVAGGNEVAAHSRSHRPMTSLTRRVRAFEFNAQSALASDIGQTPTVWVYPDSASSTETDREARRYYARVFTGSQERYTFNGPIRGFSVGRFDWSTKTQKPLVQMLRKAADQRGTLVAYVHHVNSGVSSQRSVTPQNFERALELCDRLGIRLVVA